MRVLIRTSKWAIWARRFGSFALPLAVLPVVMHRARLIESDDFVTLEAIALGFAGLGLLLGLAAFARLWVTGDRGWSKASWALVFSVLTLAPFAWYGSLAERYPMVRDVSTDYRDPPPLGVPLVVPATDPALRDTIARRFPNLGTRTYPVDPAQIFELVSALVTAEGWDVHQSRPPDETDPVGLVTASATRLLGFEDEVAIRVRGAASGSSVDMRSVPRFVFPDFGENGQRIEKLLLALDDRVTKLMRAVPAAPADAEAADGAQ